MVQRIMNTVEKTITPAELILNNNICLTERILLQPAQAKSSGQFALSDTMDEWVARQSTLIIVVRDKQLQTDCHALIEFDPIITEYPVNSYVLFTPPVDRSDKLLPRHRGRTPSIRLRTWSAANVLPLIFTTCSHSVTILTKVTVDSRSA